DLKSASRSRVLPARPITVLMVPLLSSWLADDRTSHAVAAAASATQLLTSDGEHLDAGLGELRVRRLVALVTDDDARLERDHVVAVVPLVPLRLELVATGRDELQVRDPKCVAPLVEEGALRHFRLHAGGAAGPEQDRPDLGDDGLVKRGDVAVAEG